MRIPTCLLMMGLAMAVRPTEGQEKTPIPEFTGERLYVAGVPNIYESVRREIQRLERSSAQTYYVVVIQSSGSGQWATRNYIDELYQTWLAQAAQKGRELDPNRAVIVVLARDNRQLSVHGGTVLQSRYGFRGPTIDQEIVQPHFIPHAKAGNYEWGLKVLLREIEKWLTAKDAAQREREERIRQDAEASLAQASELNSEVQRELAEKKRSGLVVRGFQNQAQQARQVLATARKALPNDPPTALQRGQQAEKTFQQIRSQLRQLAALQARAEGQLEQHQALADEVEKVLREKERAGLAVGPLAKQLEEAQQVLSTARRLVPSDPQQAWTQGQPLGTLLQTIREQAEQLPRQRRELQEKQALVAELERAVWADLDRAQRIGANIEPVAAQLRSIQEQRAAAEQQQKEDYFAAEETFATVEGQLRTQQQKLQSLYQHRRLMTRILPAIFFLLILGAMLTFLALRRARHLRVKRSVEERLKAFKDQVVGLMERLEKLKERHQFLPVSDEDFREPMAGDTLALYHQLQEDLESLWDLWVQKSEVGERAETLIASEKPFSTERCEKAQQLLVEGGAFEALEAQYQTCMEHLDRLGQAHEEAEALLQTVEVQSERLKQQLGDLSAAELATTPYQADLEKGLAGIEQARTELQSDPLHAHQVLQEAQEQITALGRWTEQVLQCFQGAQEVRGKLEKVTELVAQTRAQGFLLTEPEGNPDPLVAQGHRQRSAALLALHRGDAETAASHLDRAFTAVDRAREVTEQQIAARAYCEEQIPARRAETQRLREIAAEEQGHRDELERDFAPDSWRSVAGSQAQALDFLETFEPLVDQAAAASAAEVQHYFRAAGILEQVQQKQEETQALLRAIGRRLQTLTGLREDCQTQWQALAQQEEQIRDFIAQHDSIVREETREWLAAAEEIQHQVGALREVPRPHWPEVQQQLREAQEKLATAQREAEEDVRYHQQLTTQLDWVRRRIERAGVYLQSRGEDRWRANQRYQTAQLAWARIAQESEAPRADWARLLRELDEAATAVEKAEELAQEDVRLAQQAAAEMAEAERELRRAKGFCRWGVTASVEAAEAGLAQARLQFQAQAYEQALQSAQVAQREARQAYRDAEHRARRKERARERRRRHRVASWLSGGAWSSSSSSSSWSSSSSSSSWSGSSGSSSSSWSSGSSQSSW